MRVEEVVEHTLDQQRGVLDAAVGGVEDLLELVEHEQHTRLGGVGPGGTASSPP